MLIGFIVIIIASLVIMPETDGFKTFWGTFGLSKRKKGKNTACSKRKLVAKPDGTCESCYKNDSTKPIFNKLSNTCQSCNAATGSTKPYYNPKTGECVKFCPRARLNDAETDIIKTGGDANTPLATATDQGVIAANSLICKV